MIRWLSKLLRSRRPGQVQKAGDNAVQIQVGGNVVLHDSDEIEMAVADDMPGRMSLKTCPDCHAEYRLHHRCPAHGGRFVCC